VRDHGQVAYAVEWGHGHNPPIFPRKAPLAVHFAREDRDRGVSEGRIVAPQRDASQLTGQIRGRIAHRGARDVEVDAPRVPARSRAREPGWTRLQLETGVHPGAGEVGVEPVDRHADW